MSKQKIQNHTENDLDNFKKLAEEMKEIVSNYIKETTKVLNTFESKKEDLESFITIIESTKSFKKMSQVKSQVLITINCIGKLQEYNNWLIKGKFTPTEVRKHYYYPDYRKLIFDDVDLDSFIIDDIINELNQYGLTDYTVYTKTE